MLKKKLLKLYFRMKSKSMTVEGTKLNYVFEKDKSNSTLVIIFSAFPRTGYEATYNYLKTLQHTKANKLFILDNFGYQKRGCYYLGENGELNVQKAVLKLIETIRSTGKYEKVVCVGSSKGGYAALMFGSLIAANYIIAGAPQYFLGNYLTDNPVKDPILKSISGNNDIQTVTQLNELLPNLIKSKLESITVKIFLHYSKYDHTYNEHIESLIMDLNDNDIPMRIDEQNYKTHQEIRYWFPGFLIKSLNEIIQSDI